MLLQQMSSKSNNSSWRFWISCGQSVRGSSPQNDTCVLSLGARLHPNSQKSTRVMLRNNFWEEGPPRPLVWAKVAHCSYVGGVNKGLIAVVAQAASFSTFISLQECPSVLEKLQIAEFQDLLIRKYRWNWGMNILVSFPIYYCFV